MFNKNHIAVLALGMSLGLTLPFSTQAAQGPDELEEIKVLAHPLADNGTAQNITVLNGNELARDVQSSLGETLSGEAGIQSASFGTAVGRPIIHGLGGARVKTTQDRIDTLDVSVTSGDHAVGAETFIADQVTVLRGSSTLLYGSGSIGGVVDVATTRIHTEAISETDGRVQLRTADNANATNGAFVVDAPLSENVILHVDGFLSDADDYDIPGFAESAFQIAAEEAEAAEEGGEEEEEEAFGILEGSRVERSGGAVGLSFVGDSGFVGFSVSSLDAEYGLVGGHHEEESEEEEEEEEEEGPGIIDLEQTRFDIEAGVNNPFSGISSINFRLGVNDYQHIEFEGNGETGTVFDNEAFEARVELKHESIAGFDGAFGVQLGDRDFSAVGEEAFVPPVKTETIGLFWVGQRALGNAELEAGARWEQVDHTPSPQELPDLSFDSFSASLGLTGSVGDNLKLAGIIDISSRAPTAEELFSNGPHLATSSFEIGDPNLDKEDVAALTLSAGYGNERFEFDASVYFMQFDNYIFEVANGEEEDGLPVLLWQQADATFTGFNLQGLIHLANFADGDLDLNFLADAVRGELDGGGGNLNLPRIPSARAGLGLSWNNDSWEASVDYLSVSSQSRISTFELPTDSYEDLSLFIQRRLALSAGNEVKFFLHGRNLTDDEQRFHSSIVKDFAPAPGRRFEVGVSFDF